MKLKGLEQLVDRVPEWSTPFGVLCFFFPAALLLVLVTAVYATERFSAPWWQLTCEIVLGSLGFGWLYLFVRLKSAFNTRFGPLAYSKAASWFGFPAVVLIGMVIGHLRTLPGPAIAGSEWLIVLPAAGWTLITFATLLAWRTVQTFGVDNLVMLYVYFPEESRLVSHRIYTVLRHPAYAAVLGIAFGLALLDRNWFGLASALTFALGLWGWVRLVEERELTERFGRAYSDYRQSVPAFWPRPREVTKLFEFLIFGR